MPIIYGYMIECKKVISRLKVQKACEILSFYYANSDFTTSAMSFTIL